MLEHEILSASDVGRYLRLNVRTILRLAETGELPSFRVGHSVRFKKSDIEQLIEKQLTKSQTRLTPSGVLIQHWTI